MDECEDEMICDFAETYHIYDYKGMSPLYISVLCSGLRDDSRVKLKLAKMPINLSQMLLARMVDELAFLVWAKTKDGQKNRNRPQSVLKSLTEKKDDDVEIFHTSDDFMTAWNAIARSEENAE